jgi:hypothetical protein
MQVPSTWVETPTGLSTQGSVTMDSTGQGTIYFTPNSANQRWEVTSVVVQTNQAATSTTIPVVNIALNTVSYQTMALNNQRGATWSGNQDTWTGGTIDVGPCDYLSVVFSPPQGASGAPLVGVLAQAVLTGTKYTRRA